jgi:acetyl esterase/lipase
MGNRSTNNIVQVAAWLLCLLAALPAVTWADTSPAAAATVHRDLSYATHPDPDFPHRQTLDLYLPTKAVEAPPLVIFVHGGFWLESDDHYQIGPAVARVLVADGVAVALVRYRLAPARQPADQAQDVAAATAFLIHAAKQYGYASARIYLMGHSAGGQLASLLALRPGLLERHGLAPDALAGIISFSGIYDLAAAHWAIPKLHAIRQKVFGADPEAWRLASPLHYVRPAPPFLLMVGGDDFPGFALDAKRFAGALRGAGNARIEGRMIDGRNHFTLMDFADVRNPAHQLLLAFIGVRPAGVARP